MYPIVRLAKEVVKFRASPRLGLFETHHSTHVCWPWDIDPWRELNNGRTLTLYDLGRLVLAQRTALVPVLQHERWQLAVAGSVVRYRRRVRAFYRLDMASRLVGWDDKFLYAEQSMWHRGTCTSHLVVRMAVTDAAGLVRMDRFARAVDLPEPPPLPDWIRTWIEAEARRPWPPMSGDDAGSGPL